VTQNLLKLINKWWRYTDFSQCSWTSKQSMKANSKKFRHRQC